MRSEPDFELLPAPGISKGWYIALTASAGCAAAAGVVCASLWNLQREARIALDSALVSSRQVQALRVSVVEPAYGAVAREAAKLMQRPIDGWLRELEHCQPDKARLRDVRIDARAGRVLAQVELAGDLALAPWLQCLNAGLASPVWRATQAGAAVEGPTSMPAAWRAAWTVVLERSEAL